MNKDTATKRTQHQKRHDHLERFSLSSIDHATRTSNQLAQLSALATTIARDVERRPNEQKMLLRGLEALAQHYASEARMDMEHMSIAQMRYTSRWKEFKKQRQ